MEWVRRMKEGVSLSIPGVPTLKDSHGETQVCSASVVTCLKAAGWLAHQMAAGWGTVEANQISMKCICKHKNTYAHIYVFHIMCNYYVFHIMCNYLDRARER